MAWAFDVVSGIPRITQTGTDANLGGIATAIAAIGTVARSTAYAVGAIVRPPAANGLWYRCSTAGTSSGTSPIYNASEGGSTTDGAAVFVGFLAPITRTIAGGNHYYMPAVRVQINGTLTNANPQQNTFTCFDVEMSGGNWTSGAYASDGVTPLWNGLHFAAMRQGSNGAEETDGGLRLSSAAQFTFIGGEVQVGGSIVFNSGTTPRTYGTRWRNIREFGAGSARIRNKTANTIFSQVELFDLAFDLFVMPTTAPSIKARGSEYVYQYVGGQFGGIDARFVAFDLENPSGQYDFDNFSSGWVELYNCKAGASLRVVNQHPSSSFWVKYCVPLYQDLVITAKDTAGAAVQDVRFTATETPTNAPTVTFSTQSNLKVWDFRTPLSYQTTTNASGVALSSPVLNVWYWQTSFKQSLRFPSSTATYQGRAYNYKTMNVSVVLGASAAIPVSAGMIGLDTETTVNEATALAYTGITFAPSGATGGTVTLASNFTTQEIWNAYRAWISQFANRASNDAWNCIGGNMTMGAWNLVVNSGVTLSGSGNVTSVSTTGSVTNNGTITAIYSSSAGTSTIIELRGVAAGSSFYIGNAATGVTTLFQSNVAGGTYRAYFAPGITAPQLVAREKYGLERVAEVIPLTGGLIWYQFVDIPDVGISEATLATVQAYTAIENADKFYDRTAAFRLTEQGIKLGQIVTRDGTSINVSAPYSVLINQAAAGVYAIDANLITLKATGYANGTRYINTVLVSPATLAANTNEVLSADFEDANGNSAVTILGGDGAFELWKVTTATPTANYTSGTKMADVGNVKYRFTGLAGFDIVGVDINSNVRRRTSMAKGVYVQEFYVGSQIQLAQAPQVIENGLKIDLLAVEIEGIKGSGYTSAKNSLASLRKHVTNMTQA